MPRLKPKKPVYSAQKKRLMAMGLRNGPLFSKNAKRHPTIPQMHPKIKGARASGYQRVGRPQLNRQVDHTQELRITPRVVSRSGDWWGPAASRVELDRLPVTVDHVRDVTPRFSVRKTSKRSGGGPIKGMGPRAKSKRKSQAARPSGTRGARPGHEAKKQPKQRTGPQIS